MLPQPNSGLGWKRLRVWRPTLQFLYQAQPSVQFFVV